MAIEEKSIHRLLDEIRHNAMVFGNRKLYELLNFENRYDIDCITKELKNYTGNLEIEIYDENEGLEDEEGSVEKKEWNYLYIYDRYLDPKDISRVELYHEYSSKKFCMIFSIIIIRKFPSNDESTYQIIFDSEEDRDFWFDVIRLKMNSINNKII